MTAFPIPVRSCIILSVSSVNSVAATLSLNIFWMRRVTLSAAEVMMTLALSRFETKGRDFVKMTILCAMCDVLCSLLKSAVTVANLSSMTLLK